MKKTIQISTLFTLSLVLLTACSNFSMDEKPSAQKPGIEKVAEQAEDAGVQPEAVEPDIEDPFAARFDKEIDCGMLKDEQARTDCKFQVMDMVAQQIYSEAVRYFDLKTCAKLPTTFMERCERQIKDAGVKGPISDAEMALYRDALQPKYPEPVEGVEPEIEPVPTFDKTKCSQLTTPGYREYCEKGVNERVARYELETIFRGGDSSKCATLQDERVKTECEMFFGIFEPPLPEEEVIPVETEELVVPAPEDIEEAPVAE